MTYPQVDAFSGDAGTIRIVGHRGARGVLPENSIEGFEFVLSKGIDLIECDVVLTKDEVPVLTHNHKLLGSMVRGPDGCFLDGEEPKVAALGMEEIERFDVGRLNSNTPYGQRFPEQIQMDGVRVPKLVDLFQLISQPKYQGTNLMLEIKSDPDLIADDAARERIVTVVIDHVRRAGLSTRTLLHSFDWGLLAKCKKQASDMPISFLTRMKSNADEIGEDSSGPVTPDFDGAANSVPDRVKEAEGSLWCPYYRDITYEDLARARELGLGVAVWTVNEIEDIDSMINLRVDAIVTDYPDRVQRRLSDRGYRWAG